MFACMAVKSLHWCELPSCLHMLLIRTLSIVELRLFGQQQIYLLQRSKVLLGQEGVLAVLIVHRNLG